MARLFLLPMLLAATLAVHAQQPGGLVPPEVPAEKPLPAIRELVLDVEHNEKLAQMQSRDYTYHVHQEEQELDGKGGLKKTTITDSESVTIDGLRVDRVVARNGKPLTQDEVKKENERIDKEVAKAKDRREKRASKGEDTDARGDLLITAGRILELGSFSNPRRIDLNGRPTIVADYAGDPNAKTHNSAEAVIKDLVGTVWFDEQDRVLVRGEGHFLNDFKIGGGLILNLHKGFSFDFRTAKVNGEAWLPTTIEAQGSARFLLFGGVNGRLRLEASNYRKFHTNSTIIPAAGEIGPDGEPIPATSPDPPKPPPQP